MKEISPKDAHEILEQDPDCIYLDVRSVPEFEAGHPSRAINIPLLHLIPGGGMQPNPDFLSVVEANIPANAKVLVGCKTGGRSARACELLLQSGYSDVTNVRCGYAGAFDRTGQLVEPGWSGLGLPTSTGAGEESSYESLASREK